MTLAGTQTLPDWLVLGQERWDVVERRNQLLISALVKRNPGVRVLFVEPPLRLRSLTTWRLSRPRPVAENIWAFTPVRPIPDRIWRSISDFLESAQIRRAARRVGLRHATLWTQDPRAADLIERLPAAGLVYDLTDDWVAFESDADRRALVRAQVDALCRRAELVLACSRWLEQDARRHSSRVLYLPNAVELPAAQGAVDPELERLPHPRLGYVGTLHSTRLDVSLLLDAARLRPGWSFVFLGPDLLTREDRARLFAQPNVHYLGVRAHSQLGDYLRAFDVGLVPNLINDFTRSLDPLKTYEYLAAGLPVISTPAGIPQELAPFVARAATAAELITQAERALDASDPNAAERRRGAVAAETWEARAAAIETALGVQGGTAAGPSKPLVSVVIVSFNTKELLERCLEDLRAQAGVDLQIVVVDNASADGSPDLVRARFPEVELLELDSNVGFARANNIAFERCRGEYVLLLNSDAFVHAGAVRELVAAAQRNPASAAVGPKLLNPDQTLQRSAWPFPDPLRLSIEALGLHRLLRRSPFYEDLGVWAHDSERTVDFVIGACLLLRADALRRIGGFDESFWLYGEEADLQKRLTLLGFSVLFTPRAEVTHIGGASAMDSVERLRHFYTGQMKFLKKHRGRGAWPVARAALLVGSVLRLRWAAARTALQLGV